MENRDTTSNKSHLASLVWVALATLITMTLYEVVKEYLLPGMSRWTSHSITIIFTTAGSFLIAHVVLSRRTKLIARLQHEAQQSQSAQFMLAERLHLAQMLSDAIPSAVFFKNKNAEYLGCNAAYEEFFGVRRSDIIGKTAHDVFPAQIAKDVHASDLELLQNGLMQRHEVPAPHSDGSMRQIIYQKAAYRGDGGEIDGLVGIIIDITELKEAQLTISRQKDFLSALIDNLPVGVIAKDAKDNYRFTIWNTQSEKIFGLPRDEMIGKGDYDFFAKDEADFFRTTDEKVMRDKKIINVPSEKVTGKHGEFLARTIKVPLLGEDGSPDTLLAILEDITESKKTEETLAQYRDQLENLVKERTGELEQTNELLRTEIQQRKDGERQIEYLAYYDVLTALPNRTLLRDRITQAVESATRNGWYMALLTIDLDQFKNINDSLGHAAGDKLLKAVAERLRAQVRKEDTVARIGGDEFVLLLPNLKSIEHSSRVAEKVLADAMLPYFIDHQELHITASIGISICPDNGTGSLALIRCADTAMYEAKAAGRNGFAFFNPEMTKRAFETLRIGNELRHAIENDEFVLHYQPKIDLASGRIIGAEALIRWQHPERGLVFPGYFIGIAEETGLIQPMGEWVMRTACRQNKAWQTAGLPPIGIAVNLSARQFVRSQIEQITAGVLQETGLDARYLELEITESMIMQNAEKAIAVMQALKDIGAKLSIDDFGTGYSSLSYLKRFPIDTLKIDQSFVRDLGDDADDAAIVTAIIGLAKSLDLRVIAEGVEKKEQLEFLREKGCDEVQGYFFSKPIPAADFEKLLRQ
ncbi:EAL domain-containing protein [soil metagenome]